MTDEIKRWFRFNRWAADGDESLSGRGSTLGYTENLRAALPELLRRLEVKTFLDAPCGDFNWMKEVDLNNVSYVGMDIVDELIAHNRERYPAPNRTFLAGDITDAVLPTADLMMCRDCLFHLPYAHIGRFFGNFVAHDIPLLLLTSNELHNNKDIDRPGHWRQLNMRRPPFSFPEPLETITDWVDGFPRRYLGLWTKEQIAAVSAAFSASRHS